MSVRDVFCAFCFRLGDFQTMFMCPVCRKTICKTCKHDGPLRTGFCGKRVPCKGEKGPPAAPTPAGSEGDHPAP